MIKTTGYFYLQKSSQKFAIVFDLDKNNFNKLKTHINNSMFFACRRIAPKYKALLLNSIGDHITNSGEQNLKQADICIEVSIEDTLSDIQINTLDSSDSWYICVACDKKEAYMFSIDKETQFIKARSYATDTNGESPWDRIIN
jgi:hypothetical protein